MDADIKNLILQHAEHAYPREACGLLLEIGGRAEYFPCRNLASGEDHFIIHPDDYAKCDAAGRIVAVVHSHPNARPTPSQADRVACEASGLPWHIVSWPGREWAYLQPEGYQAPLIGRQFSHGVLDCYTLIRDWYRQERGIELPDFKRRGEWWKEGGNLYVENFAKAGFIRLTDVQPKPGDVLLIQVMSPVPNHGAIFLGDNLILHHVYGRLSCREVYGGYWKKNTTHILYYDH